MKPRRWIERLKLRVAEDGEHFVAMERFGFSEYLQRKMWQLSDYDVGQLAHPGVVYGKVRRQVA